MINPVLKSRIIENFNHDWKFYKGDISDAFEVDFVDNDWRVLDLPHDWSIEGPFDSKWASATGYLPAGIGWYRKRFTVPKTDQERKVQIYFEGIYNNSEVWVNGISIGKRPNGYISFYYDLSAIIHYGDENVIAVKVDHSKYADSRWYTGSGIYRNVRLIKTEKLYIKPWGVYARATVLGEDLGSIDVEISVMNDSPTSSKVIILSELYSKGKAVGHFEQSITIPANEESLIQGKIEIVNPIL